MWRWARHPRRSARWAPGCRLAGWTLDLDQDLTAARSRQGEARRTECIARQSHIGVPGEPSLDRALVDRLADHDIAAVGDRQDADRATLLRSDVEIDPRDCGSRRLRVAWRRGGGRISGRRGLGFVGSAEIAGPPCDAGIGGQVQDVAPGTADIRVPERRHVLRVDRSDPIKPAAARNAARHGLLPARPGVDRGKKTDWVHHRNEPVRIAQRGET